MIKSIYIGELYSFDINYQPKNVLEKISYQIQDFLIGWSTKPKG